MVWIRLERLCRQIIRVDGVARRREEHRAVALDERGRAGQDHEQAHGDDSGEHAGHPWLRLQQCAGDTELRHKAPAQTSSNS